MPEIDALLTREYAALEPELATEIPKSKCTLVGVAYDGNGKLIARTFMVIEARFEQPWTAPEWGESDLLPRLEKALAAAAAEIGIDNVYTLTSDPDTERFLEHLGYEKQPMNIWRRPISEGMSHV